MTPRVLLWEHAPTELDAADAHLLELACRRIWRTRNDFGNGFDGNNREEPGEESQQRIIRFDGKGSDRVIATPGHYIGSIRTPWHQFIIFPKIHCGCTESEVLRYLGFQFHYAYGLRLPESSAASSGVADSVELFAEALFHSFAGTTVDALRQHNYMAYDELAENANTVRGRIDFGRHIRENLSKGRQDRMACVHEVYQENSRFLRIVKHVASIVERRTTNPRTTTMLREVLLRLRDVDDVRCSLQDTLSIRLTRYQSAFTTVLSYCSLILSSKMGDPSSGTGAVDHYLIDTHAFFERFVAGFMQTVGRPRWLVQPKKLGYLARDSVGRIFQYENDAILVDQQSGRKIIVDMKYKSVDLSDRGQKYGISQNDLYQMVSYSLRRNITDVILVYPTTGTQNPQVRRLAVDQTTTGETIAIAACMIPMADVSPAAVWDVISEALDDDAVDELRPQPGSSRDS